jgi:hypothetical protein
MASQNIPSAQIGSATLPSSIPVRLVDYDDSIVSRTNVEMNRTYTINRNSSAQATSPVQAPATAQAPAASPVQAASPV